MAGVTIRLGKRTGRPGDVLWLEGARLVLGRSRDAHLRLDSDIVSREHCAIELRDGVWRIVDLRSRNGVFLDNVQVRDAPLRAGHGVLLGPGGPRFEVLATDPAAPAPEDTADLDTRPVVVTSRARVAPTPAQPRPQPTAPIAAAPARDTRDVAEAPAVDAGPDRRAALVVLAIVVIATAAGALGWRHRERIGRWVEGTGPAGQEARVGVSPPGEPSPTGSAEPVAPVAGWEPPDRPEPPPPEDLEDLEDAPPLVPEPLPEVTTRAPPRASAVPEIWAQLRGTCDRAGAFGAVDDALGAGESWALETDGSAGIGLAVTAERLFVGSGSRVVAVSRDDGSELWSFSGVGRFRASPLVADGVVWAAGYGGVLLGLDAATGAVKVRHPLGSPVESSPVVAGDLVLVATLGGDLVAWDRREDREFARVPLLTPVAAPLTLAGDALLVADLGGLVRCIDAIAGGIRWERDVGAPVVAAPSACGERVVVATDTGRVVALALVDGEELWQGDMPGGVEAAPLVTPERVVVVSRDGVVVSLEAGDGSLRWKRELAVVCTSPPGLAGGHVVLAAWDGALHGLSAESGEPVLTIRTRGPLECAPVFADGALYVADADGVVTARGVRR